jgi:hypothetical protein
VDRSLAWAAGMHPTQDAHSRCALRYQSSACWPWEDRNVWMGPGLRMFPATTCMQPATLHTVARCGYQPFFLVLILSDVGPYARLPKLMHGNGCLTGQPARQQPTFCLAGQRLQRRAATPRLPACCRDSGFVCACKDKATSLLAGHASLWALPSTGVVDSSALHTQMGRGRAKLFVLRRGLGPAIGRVFLFRHEGGGLQ